MYFSIQLSKNFKLLFYYLILDYYWCENSCDDKTYFLHLLRVIYFILFSSSIIFNCKHYIYVSQVDFTVLKYKKIKWYFITLLWFQIVVICVVRMSISLIVFCFTLQVISGARNLQCEKDILSVMIETYKIEEWAVTSKEYFN